MDLSGTAEREYESQSAPFYAYGPKMVALVRELLDREEITYLDVTHRVKTFKSASAKIEADSSKYPKLTDLHDLLGLRVVTYLASDVEKVVDIIRRSFDVDDARSLDKQDSLPPDRFGYLSYHLIVRLNDARTALPEWQAFADCYFEFQIRSVLQHAWAQIEHDLGYKSVAAIPAQLRRRFARLAGLLELADAEFDAISGAVQAHVEEVQAAVASGDEVNLDLDSLRALIDGNIVRDADQAIASAIGAKLEHKISRHATEGRLEELQHVGITTTADVERALSSESDAIIRFASEWLSIPQRPRPDRALEEGVDENGIYRELPPAISLFYLYIHLMITANRVGELMLDLGRPGESSNLVSTHTRIFGHKH